MKKSPTLALVLSITSTIALTFYINKVCLRGAQHGADNISKQFTMNANFNPDKAYWEMLPYSLLFASIVGILIFILVYVITPKKIMD